MSTVDLDPDILVTDTPVKRKRSYPPRIEAFINEVTLIFDMANGERVAAKMTDATARDVAVLLNNHFAQKHREFKKFMA